MNIMNVFVLVTYQVLKKQKLEPGQWIKYLEYI